MKKVLILGYGISGQAAARLAVYKGYSVTIADEGNIKSSDAINRYQIISGWKPGTAFDQYDLAVISPGISIHSPMADAVRKSGTPVIGELEFAADSLPCKIIAITGTNGKTTTTELTTALLQGAGYRAESAGNIGIPLSDLALELHNKTRSLDLLVVETSSFQLESMEHYKPYSAAFLNLASDHINRHGSLKKYADAKFRLFQNMNRSRENCIINRNLTNEWNRHYPDTTPVTFTSGKENADFHVCNNMLCFRNSPIFNREKISLPGEHNTENILAALALFHTIAGDTALFSEEVKKTLSGFSPDRHRLECFAEKNGIRYIDDSKATNPHSVNAALRTFGKERNILLLLGGSDKDMDFSCIAEDSKTVKQAFLYGQSAQKIFNTLQASLPCTVMDSFESAVENACRGAESGDTVMLSPACASFDLFKSYKARGERFQELVFQYLKK